LGASMRVAVAKVFHQLASDDEVGAIVLTGKGRAFCAGLDLKELASGKEDNDEAVSDLSLKASVTGTGKPIIGAINGFAITGGFELALMSDFMIASENAKFADTHSQVGIVPGWGITQRLPRLIGINRAKELSFTGSFLGAEMAERWGLVNRVVASEDLLAVCQAMGEEIVSADARTLLTVKRVMDAGWENTLEAGLKIESRANREHMKETTPEFLEQRRKIVMERGRRKNK
ncbi:MAG: enoyl-CoA hydratase, partial [Pseudomonadales bacterium]|nr:enoyl-CoA hydratase [Pseudomonadales bacterium]